MKFMFFQESCCGMLCGCLNDGAACIFQNTALITKAAIPPEIFPLRVVLTHFLNYLLTLPLLLGFSLLRGLCTYTFVAATIVFDSFVNVLHAVCSYRIKCTGRVLS